MANVTEVRIGYTMGATLTIDGDTWAKPGTEASIAFDGIPSDEELATKWRWLVEKLVEPQFDDLFSVIQERVRAVPSRSGQDGPGSASERVIERVEPLPPGVPYS